MKFAGLVDSGASKTEQHEYLVEGTQVATTIRILSNLKDEAAEVTNLKSMSFSAFACMCMTNELAKGEE